MATSGYVDEDFSNRSNFYLRVSVSLDTIDVANNRSRWNWSLRIYNKTNYTGTWSGATTPWSIYVGGHTANGTTPAGTYDFRDGASFHSIATGTTGWINHGPSGAVSFSISGSAGTTPSGSYPFGTSTPGPKSITGPTIPRASVSSFASAPPFDVGTSVTINTNRASTSFTHTLELWEYGVGAEDPILTIASGVGASYNWSIPNSVATYFPNSTSKTFFLRTETFDGATYIGRKDLVFNLRAPDTMVPTASSISLSEATTVPNVASIVGKYVQGLSTLNFTINGASGVQGSTITKRELLVGSQVIDAPSGSGTTGVLGVSGASIPVTARLTDSRGRIGTYVTNIEVLAWTMPKVQFFHATRSTGATADPEGDDIKITLQASISSLLNGATQKNQLTYRTFVKESSAPTWPGTPAQSANAGTATSVNTSWVLSGGYDTEKSYDVLVEVSDKFGTQPNQTFVSVSLPTAHWTATGVGIMKYHEQGALDVGGDVYANDELLLPGASDAETQAGSLTTKAVTPASLSARTATESRTGVAEVATVAEAQGASDDSRFITPAKMIPIIGQRLIIPTSTNGTVDANGVASFSAVSVFEMDGVFTADFRRYVVYYDLAVTAGAAGGLFMQLKTGGTPNATTWYGTARHYGSGSSSFSVVTSSGSDRWELGGGSGLTHVGQFTILNPAHAEDTRLVGQCATLGSNYIIANAGNHFNTTTQFDGFRFYTTSGGGRKISGNITVYGVY